MIKLNKIYNQDCLEGLKQLPDECIDLCIMSPPYNLGKGHHTGNKRHNPYNDNLPESEYQQWQIEVLNELYRVLKPDGSIMYNHKNRIKDGKQISPYEWLFKTSFTIKQEIIWVNRSQNFDKIRFYPWTERVYWLTKSPQTKMFNSINHCDFFDYNEWKPVGTKGQHIRAFPLKMVEDLISCFPDSQIILDPFMGSGTTAIASINTKRNYIGFELDTTYCGIANGRIQDIVTKTQ